MLCAVRVIHWFRRDLRLSDNVALTEAVRESGGDVLPLFILDDALLRGEDVSPARLAFMLDSLRALDEALRPRGSHLVVRRGNPREVLPRVIAESGAQAVFFNRDYTPLARRRDEALTVLLQGMGVRVRSFKDLVLVEGDELLTGSGKPYVVFTPYKRAWLAKVGERVTTLPAPERLATPTPESLPIPDLAELGVRLEQHIPRGGEAEAQRLLQAFISDRIARYDALRDFPAEDATSRLSPHLRFGTISPRQCLQAALEAKYLADMRTHAGFDTWISELVWREFYIQVLYHFPHADRGNFRQEYDALQWGSGSAALDEARFAAWCEGRTGYPIVDAAMRQLNQIGWMHNRARMIVASFLTKDLWLDWRWGERYFMRQLVDGDPAANNGGWQWAAGTGTDAQPYYRVFNPTLQSQRFDPQGAYIRRWLPELARVPAEFIHEPWRMPPMEQLRSDCLIGKDYPRPLVDHAAQKDEMVRRFKMIKASS